MLTTGMMQVTKMRGLWCIKYSSLHWLKHILQRMSRFLLNTFVFMLNDVFRMIRRSFPGLPTISVYVILHGEIFHLDIKWLTYKNLNH